MGGERGECLGQWRVFLPQEGGFRLLGRIETCGGHRLAVVEVRPPVPRSLLNAHQVIGIVEWISAATDINTVEGGPQLLVAIELQAEGFLNPEATSSKFDPSASNRTMDPPHFTLPLIT